MMGACVILIWSLQYMLYGTVCVGDDCHGADARWRLEGESDQNETNVRSQLACLHGS